MQYQNPNTNFMAQAPREMRQIMRPRRWPYVALSLLLVAAILAVLAIPYGALGLSAYRQAQLDMYSLERAQELAVNLELEEENIRKIITNNRKLELKRDLRKDLMEAAIEKNELVIY